MSQKELEQKGKIRFAELSKSISVMESKSLTIKEQLDGMQKSLAVKKKGLSKKSGKVKGKEEAEVAALEEKIASKSKENHTLAKKIEQAKQQLLSLEKGNVEQSIKAAKEDASTKKSKAEIKLKKEIERLKGQLRNVSPEIALAKEIREAKEDLIEAKGGITKYIHNLKIVKAANFLRDQKEFGIGYQIRDKLNARHNKKVKAVINLKRLELEQEKLKRNAYEKAESKVKKAAEKLDFNKSKKKKLHKKPEDDSHKGLDKVSKVLSKKPDLHASPRSKKQSDERPDNVEVASVESSNKRLEKDLMRREVSALEKIAIALSAEDNANTNKKSSKLPKLPDLNLPKLPNLKTLGNVLAKVGTVVAGLYGAKRAYDEVKKLYTGKDENGNELDGAEKAKSIARLATQAAFTTIGGLLGGPQGAALAAGLAPIVSDAAEKLGETLASTKFGQNLGEIIGKSVEFLSDLPNKWNSFSKTVSDTVTGISNSVSTFVSNIKDKAKQTYESSKEKVSNTVSKVVDGAKSIGSSILSGTNSFLDSAKSVVSSGASKVSSAASEVVTTATNKVAKIVPQVEVAATKVVDGAKNVSSSVASGVSSAVRTASDVGSKAISSISEAAGKLWTKNRANVDMSGLQPAVQQNFLGMANDYFNATGKKIPVNSAYRSRAQQEAEYKKDPMKAAKPGRSPHEKGIAIDTNSAIGDDLDKRGLLAKWGFSRPAMTKRGKHEKWHLQVAGTARKAAELGINNGDFVDTTSAPITKTYGSETVASNQPVANANTKVVAETSVPSPVVSSLNTSVSSANVVSSGNTMQAASNSPKMSVESIPTFSYADPTFFALNLGALA